MLLNGKKNKIGSSYDFYFVSLLKELIILNYVTRYKFVG